MLPSPGGLGASVIIHYTFLRHFSSRNDSAKTSSSREDNEYDSTVTSFSENVRGKAERLCRSLINDAVFNAELNFR